MRRELLAFAVLSVLLAAPKLAAGAEPTVQASDVRWGLRQNEGELNLSWTPGNGDGSIVLMKEKLPVDSDPVDGETYTADALFGAGDQIGSGNYVVYVGSGSQVTITILSSDLPYYVAVYAYAGADASIDYRQTDPARGNSGHNAAHGLVNCSDCHFGTGNFHGSFQVPRDADQAAKCKTCHTPGGLAAAKSAVDLHKGSNYTTLVDCGSCHEVHNQFDFVTTDTHSGVSDSNVGWIRPNTIKYITGALEPGLFQANTGFFAWDDDNSPWNGICQTCHTQTDRHRNSAAVAHSHEMPTPSTCTACHTHEGEAAVDEDGFKPSCGFAKCHDTTQATRRAVVGEFVLASHHVAGGSVTGDDCWVCHYEAVDIDYHRDNTVDLRDPDDGTASTLISFSTFSRDINTDVLELEVIDVQNNFCMKCHDSDGATATNYSGNALQPFSAADRDVPNVFDRFDPANAFHHAVRGAGSNPYTILNGSITTMEVPWNQDATHDQISCFDCHGVPDGSGIVKEIGHGSTNQRMLRTAVDFDTMETTTLPAGMGLTVETFCTTCHKASVYVSASAGSIFEYHGTGQNQHGADGGNELGCMGCHGGIRDEGGLNTGGKNPEPVSNGAARGNIHGGSFTWPSQSFASGTLTQCFMLGGWMSGWLTVGSTGECRGGECSHSNSSKSYTR